MTYSTVLDGECLS